MKTFKTIIAIILLTLAMATLGYFLWLQPRTPIFAQSINLQEGIETELIITSDDFDNKALVPKGRVVDGETETEEIVFEYKILWHTSNEELSDVNALGSLVVDIDYEIVDSESSHLLNVSVEYDEPIELGVVTTVRVRLTLTEPANKEEYEDVADKKIKVNISFRVELQE